MNQEPKHIKAKPDEIVFSLTNPRRHGGDFTKRPDWSEFLDSVRQHGVKQWPLVRPLPASRTDAAAKGRKYELIAGDRRVTAAQTLKLPEINLVLETMDDAKVVEIQQIENLQREDLSPLEEAQGYADWRDSLIKAGAAKTVEEAVAHICTKINRKRSAVFQRLALLDTSPVVQKALKDGELDPSKAAIIAQIPVAKDQAAALKECGRRNMSTRDLAKHVEQEYRISLKGAPFRMDQVMGKHPVCTTCPHRTGNMHIEGTDPNVCTKPDCFRNKCADGTKDSEEKIAGVLSESTWRKVQYTGEYVNENNTCHQDNKSRSWKAVLGKLAPPIYLAIGQDYGRGLKLRRLFKSAEAEKIAKEHKLIESPDRRQSAAELKRQRAERARQEKRNAREKMLRAASEAILKKLITAAEKAKTITPILKVVAKHVCFSCSVMESRGVRNYGRDKFYKWIDKMDEAQLRGLIVQGIAADSGPVDYSGDWDSDFAACCAGLGINLAVEEKKFVAEQSKTTPPAGAGKKGAKK